MKPKITASISLDITITYIVVGYAWILLSDKALVYLFPESNIESLTNYQTYKGISVITISGILLYWLIRNLMSKIDKSTVILEKEKESFKVLFDKHHDAMWICNETSLDILQVNEAALTIYPYSEEEYKSLNFLSLFDPPIKTKRDLFDQIHKKQHFKQKDKTGRFLHVEISRQPVNFRDGKAIMFMSHDITARVEAQQAQLKSEERLRLLIQNAGSIIVGLTEDYTIFEWNNEAEKTFNISKTEALGVNFVNSWVAEHDRDFIESTLNNVMDGLNLSIDYQHNLEPEKPLHIRWTLAPFYQKNSEPGIIAIGQDITHRKIYENQIEFQANILSQINESVVAIDNNQDIIYVNRKAEEVYNQSNYQTLGKPLRFLYAYEWLSEQQKEEGLKQLEEKGYWKGENIHIKNDGTTLMVESSLSTLKEGEHSIGFLAIIRDITERKAHEEQIKASLQEKELLIKEIYHRVKNNLQIVTSLLRLQSQGVDDPRIIGILKESENRVYSISLVHEKLYQAQNLAKISMADYIPGLARYLLNSYVGHNNRIELVTHAHDTVLGIDQTIPLGLILNELISNSIKYAFKDNFTGQKLEISFITTEDQHQLTVRDNGRGFDWEETLRTSKSMGLTLVNLLTQQINGTIEFSKINGTEIKISFSVPDFKQRI